MFEAVFICIAITSLKHCLQENIFRWKKLPFICFYVNQMENCIHICTMIAVNILSVHSGVLMSVNLHVIESAITHCPLVTWHGDSSILCFTL